MTDDHSTVLARLMKEAITLCWAHVHDGGIPFAAVVVDGEGAVRGRGFNRVREHHDPTAHAEVEAIRDACDAQGAPYLHGATLLASGEPCAMCYLTALYAGITQVLFAVDRDDAAAHGFDYRSSYTVFATDPRHWKSPAVRQLAVPGSLDPLLAFRSRVVLT